MPCNQSLAQSKIWGMLSRLFGFAVLALAVAVWAQAGNAPDPNAPKTPQPNTQQSSPSAPSLAPPRSDRVRADDLGTEFGQSSSKDNQIDLDPPADDAKAHPQSSAAVAEAGAGLSGSNGITEFHTWDPHKAAKSVEVGDFYFKRQNYRAAEDRDSASRIWAEAERLALVSFPAVLAAR